MASKADVNSNFDAERLSQEAAKGEKEIPKVNVEADYARSKEFDVAEIDQTGAGSEAAQKATASKQDQSSSEGTQSDSQTTGDPDAFRSMAKEVNRNL